jgi:hypothetical protein
MVQQSESIEGVSRGPRFVPSPASLRNLEKRVLWQDQRKCKSCRRPARKGSPYCPAHDGPRRIVLRAGRAERSTLKAMQRVGLLPLELLASAVWRNLAGLPTSVRSPLRLRLVLMWGQRDFTPLAFAQVWRLAIDVGRAGAKRKQAAWCEDL